MNKKETYAELLKDPRWVMLSKDVRHWDRDVCCLCGDSGKSAHLQVHHIYYDKTKKPWEYNRKSLITVCDKCHKTLHRSEKDFYKHLQDLLCQMGELGYTKSAILHILDMIVEMTKRTSCHDALYGFLARGVHPQDLILLHSRERKNNMYAEKEYLHKKKLLHARKAHEWATGNHKDFNEEAYYNGEYDEEIKEYENEFED